MQEKIVLRTAVKKDARALAELFNMAGEGIPAYLWRQQSSHGEAVLDVGAQRAAARKGSFSHGPALVAEVAGQVVGMLLGYRLSDPCVVDPPNHPEVIRPLIELESLVPGSWYVNAVAAFERWRGAGIGTRLMAEAERLAGEDGADRITLIVAEENSSARQLYLKLGYRPVATRPVVPFPGCPHGGDWVLMGKSLR